MGSSESEYWMSLTGSQRPDAQAHSAQTLNLENVDWPALHTQLSGGNQNAAFTQRLSALLDPTNAGHSLADLSALMLPKAASTGSTTSSLPSFLAASSPFGNAPADLQQQQQLQLQLQQQGLQAFHHHHQQQQHQQQQQQQLLGKMESKRGGGASEQQQQQQLQHHHAAYLQAGLGPSGLPALTLPPSPSTSSQATTPILQAGGSGGGGGGGGSQLSGGLLTPGSSGRPFASPRSYPGSGGGGGQLGLGGGSLEDIQANYAMLAKLLRHNSLPAVPLAALLDQHHQQQQQQQPGGGAGGMEAILSSILSREQAGHHLAHLVAAEQQAAAAAAGAGSEASPSGSRAAASSLEHLSLGEQLVSAARGGAQGTGQIYHHQQQHHQQHHHQHHHQQQQRNAGGSSTSFSGSPQNDLASQRSRSLLRPHFDQHPQQQHPQGEGAQAAQAQQQQQPQVETTMDLLQRHLRGGGQQEASEHHPREPGVGGMALASALKVEAGQPHGGRKRAGHEPQEAGPTPFSKRRQVSPDEDLLSPRRDDGSGSEGGEMDNDTVLCKTRAKRGCATHPRSIAERVRRTRISENMKRLQSLIPDLDKQANTADMLDEAVEYMKYLQHQVEVLSEGREIPPHRSKYGGGGSSLGGGGGSGGGDGGADDDDREARGDKADASGSQMKHDSD
eukprot:jgi/Mesen1/9676/ME000680S09082